MNLRPVVLIIVAVGAVLYLAAIFVAGVQSLQQDAEPAIPEVAVYLVTLIGAALATHFGAVFGISQFTGGNPRPIPGITQVSTWSVLPERKVDRVSTPDGEEQAKGGQYERLQQWAVYFYVFSLILALTFWILDGLSDSTSEIIRNMTWTFVGVIGGVVAIALNVRPQNTTGT